MNCLIAEERSTQDLPTFVTDSLLSSLSSRVEAGILELNDANTEVVISSSYNFAPCTLVLMACLTENLLFGRDRGSWSFCAHLALWLRFEAPPAQVKSGCEISLQMLETGHLSESLSLLPGHEGKMYSTRCHH